MVIIIYDHIIIIININIVIINHIINHTITIINIY